MTTTHARPRRTVASRSVALVLAALSACASDDGAKVDAPAAPTARDFDAVVERFFDAKLARYPTFATVIGDHRFDDRLMETGLAASERYVAALAPLVDEAARIAATLGPALDDERRLTLAVLTDELENERTFARLAVSTLGVDQMDGPQATFASFATTQHPMKDARDAKNLLARYRAMPGHIDGIIADLELGLARGQTSPVIVVDRVIAQLDALVDGDASESAFVAAAQRVPTSVAREQRASLVDELERAARDDVIASFARMRTFLRERYRPHARENPSISSIPGGDAVYAFFARYHTTTTLTPDEIHALGLAELERIEAAMGELARERGHTGTVRAFLDEMRADEAGYAKSRDELLAAYRAALDDAKRALPRAFGRLPKLDVEVRVMDAARERDAPAGYYESGTIEDGRPGVFIANLHRHDERPLMNARALTFHEAVPGHHLQIALAQEATSLPAVRRHGHYSAFVEGWALYSEDLAGELGLYPTLEAKLGALGFAAWRAARLVVDTGLHAKGWSRQHAIDFLAAHTTLGKIDVENEIDRYIAWPGQALAYMVGKLRIIALRRELEAKLGASFSLSRFHDVLLGSGPLPLALLEEHVRRTLVERRGD